MQLSWLTIFLIYPPIIGLLLFGLWGFLSFYGGALLNWLDNWQSLIGSMIAAVVAIGLFQWQRKLDESNAVKSRVAVFEIVLKQVHSKVNHLYFEDRAKRFRNIASSIRATHDELHQSEWCDSEVRNDIQNLIRNCERTRTKIMTIPCDQYLPFKLRNQVLEIEHFLDWLIDDFEKIDRELVAQRNSRHDVAATLDRLSTSTDALFKTLIQTGNVDK